MSASDELVERLLLTQETNLPDGEWDMPTFYATRTLMARVAKRHIQALTAENERLREREAEATGHVHGALSLLEANVRTQSRDDYAEQRRIIELRQFFKERPDGQ